MALAQVVSMRKALILDSDSRTAAYFQDALERMHVTSAVARSLLDVGPHLLVPPPHLLVVGMPSKDVPSYLDFASSLRANRGTACVFVVDRFDTQTANALADIGEPNVLCKPIHREQLEATVLLALRRQERESRQEPAAADVARTRERYLEKTLSQISAAISAAGIGPVSDSYGIVMLPGLRPREEEVVRLLLQHVRVPAIAERLGITQETVRNHLKGAFKRTGVSSQQELLDYFSRTARGHAQRPGDS